VIDPQDINQKAEALKSAVKAKYGVRGKTLAARLGKAGRLLPKRVHHEGLVIQEAMDKMHHPRLAATVDPMRLEAAFLHITNHLDGVDPNDRRKGKVLGWLGGQVFNLILIAALLVALMWWRGLIGQ